MKKALALILSLTLILSSAVMIMPVYADNEESTSLIDYIYYNDFSEIADTASFTVGASNTSMSTVYDSSTSSLATGFELTTDKTLKIYGTADYYTGFDIDVKGDNASVAKTVLSYNVKPYFNKDAAYYYGALKDNTGTNTVAFYQASGSRGIYSGMTADKFWTTVNLLESVEAFGDWYNITIVYDNDSTKINNRDIYINGVYKGTFVSNATLKTYNYALTGKLEVRNYTNLRDADYIEWDEIKVYEYPEELKFEVAGTSGNEMTVNFNVIPDSSSVAAEDFTLTSGSTSVNPTAVTFSSADPRQATLTFADTFTSLTTYTLSVANITAGTNAGDVADDLSITEAKSVTYTTALDVDDSEPEEINYLWNDDFSGTTLNSSYTGYGSDDGPQTYPDSYAITSDGTLRMTAANKAQNYIYATTPYLSAGSDDTKVVVSYKFKTDYLHSVAGNRLKDTKSYGLSTINAVSGSLCTEETGTDPVGTYSANEWINVTCVYSYNSVSTYIDRDVYINGEYVATVVETANDYYAKKLTEFKVALTFYNSDEEDSHYVEYDDLKIYTLPSSLTFSVGEVTEKTVKLDFNMIPDSVTASNFSVTDSEGNAVAISSADIDPANSTDVYILFEEKLTPSENYYITASGLKAGYHSESSADVITTPLELTTGTRVFQRAIPDYDFGEFAESNGKVSISVTNNTSDTPVYTLIYAGYTVNEDETVKMTGYTSESVTILEGTNTYSTQNALTGNYDYTKVFLWNGLKSVTPSVTFGE